MVSAYSIFCDAFSDKKVSESVLDYPNGVELSKDVWDKRKDGFVLKKDISKKIKDISSTICKKFGFKDTTTVIIGSICTNSYSEKSDIDVHIEVEGYDKKDEKDMRILNNDVREFFSKKFGNVTFGTHEVEIFVQNNKYQDRGSRGAYNVDTDEWIVEPQIKEEKFDPYEEYFEKSMNLLEKDDVIGKIGKTILNAVIISNIVQKIKDNDGFMSKLSKYIDELSEESKEIFDTIRKTRRMSSSPKNDKDSENMRNDKDWNIKDAAFKLMGDSGFLAILKDISNVNDIDGDLSDKTKFILDTIKTNLFQN